MVRASIITICILLLLCSYYCAPVSSVNHEGAALLSLKQSLQNIPRGSPLSNWNPSDKTPCLWHGVTCSGGRVIRLKVPYARLAGSLSPSLGSLTSLRYLNITSNNFTGRLPVQLFTGARALQILALAGNSFSGRLPPEIGNLTRLSFLDLSENSLHGPIPASLIQCRRLESLHLGHNRFMGPIPEGLGGNLSGLQSLNLSFNRLSRWIPDDIGKLSSLRKTLDLSHNHLSGEIPASLGSLPEDVYIDLSYNNLSGPIPQSSDLGNKGPTAFIGNPYLCGVPLPTPCPSSPPPPPHSIQYQYPEFPSEGSGDSMSNKTRTGGSISRAGIVSAIAVGTTVGVLMAAMLLTRGYRKLSGCRFGNILRAGTGTEERKLSFCFGKDSTTEGQETAQHDLVRLDTKVDFDLDELLRAPALVLGKSRIGILYKVKIEKGPVLAVRRLGEGGPQQFKEFQAEVEAIGKLRHPNIVTLRAYYWSANEKLLIYDYIPNGDLAAVIQGNGRTESTSAPLSWAVRLAIIRGIAKGLTYLHDASPKRYVHGDLKPSNVLLGKNMEPLITDFGLSHLAQISATGEISPGQSLTSITIPELQNSPCSPAGGRSQFYYQAPEALNMASKPSQKWDVFSLGVILLEMITGRTSGTLPMGSSGMDLVRWILLCVDENKPLSVILDLSLAPELRNQVTAEEILGALKIGLACVDENPEKRPPMKQVSDALHKLT